MAARKDIELFSEEGGALSIRSDKNEPDDFIQWYTPAGHLYGIAENTLEARSFFRRALRRLEKDAKRKAVH